MNPRVLLPLTLPLVFAVIVLVFALQAPGFLSGGNLKSLVLNNFVLLAIVAIGMTYAVAAGGIDLSVGTALDFASFSFVVLLNGGHGWAVAATGALVAALLVGVVNAGLIAGLRISPFLATLGTLFIGTSAQQLLSDGGQPIYISQASTTSSTWSAASMMSRVMPTSQSPLAEPSLRWMYGLSFTVNPRLRRICWNCCCLLSPRSMA